MQLMRAFCQSIKLKKLFKAEKVQNVARVFVTSILNTMRETYHTGSCYFSRQEKNACIALKIECTCIL